MKALFLIPLLSLLSLCLSAQSQLDIQDLKSINEKFVDAYNKVFDNKVKYAKMKKSKKLSLYGENFISVSDWVSLKTKQKQKFIDKLSLNEILNDEEIEMYYNYTQFFGVVHLSFHACVSNIPQKRLKHISKDLAESERYCNEILVGFWNAQNAHAADFEKYKSFVSRIYNTEHVKDEMRKLKLKEVDRNQYPIMSVKLLHEAMANTSLLELSDQLKAYKKRYQL